METYAEFIRRSLNRKRDAGSPMSQAELARQTNSSASFMADMLKSRCLPDYSRHKAIAAALGLSFHEQEYACRLIGRQKAAANPFVRELVAELRRQLDLAREDSGPDKAILCVPVFTSPETARRAGLVATAQATAESYVALPGLVDPSAFGCMMRDDSMSPTFADGDIVVFTRAQPPRRGDV